MKKKLLVLMLLSICLMGCSTSDAPEEPAEKTPEGAPFIHQMVEKKAFKDQPDGWVYFLSIQYEKIDAKSATIKDNYKEDIMYVNFDGMNLKYKELDDSYLPVIDKETGEEIDQGNVIMPSLSTMKTLKGEVKTINDYFRDKKFSEPIEVADLNDLTCDSFDKNMLVELYNEALNNLPESFGMFALLPAANSTQVKDAQGNTWQGSYIGAYGRIAEIGFECINGDAYFSDIAERESGSREMKIQENLDQMEKHIIDTQVFSIDNMNWKHADVMDDDIIKSLNALLKSLYTGKTNA